MRALNILACLVAFLIASGEIARFWGSPRFFPMAFDELLVAAALVFAVWRSPRDGTRWHIGAWGALCGLSLVLFVETLDHQLHGPFKEAGTVYLIALGGMLIVGVWALLRACRLPGVTSTRS